MERNNGSETTKGSQFVKDIWESAIYGGLTSIIQTEVIRNRSSVPFSGNLIKESFARGISSAVQKKLGF